MNDQGRRQVLHVEYGRPLPVEPGWLREDVPAQEELVEARHVDDHTLVRAVAEFDPKLIIGVSTNTQIERAAEKIGIRFANTFLADRAYDDEGALVSRKIAGSVIKDRDAVLQRVKQLLEDGNVTTITGKKLNIKVHSILLHGDTPGALELARTIRGAIEAVNGRIVPVSRLV